MSVFLYLVKALATLPVLFTGIVSSLLMFIAFIKLLLFLGSPLTRFISQLTAATFQAIANLRYRTDNSLNTWYQTLPTTWIVQHRVEWRDESIV
ncbi:hypothetical protein K470DRAFT_8482 [Piedraia hortae CBS 480.64]|uniref:Uncharacterized protein n=1 Tax=Piedraia hortae CBS 480.64 TaxID=1314780 RepID=A0A6A7C4M2_9PEZI|nr:hypothetical protein K470DRAFT_8482 [Piedraia hortae CBS 480.64]